MEKEYEKCFAYQLGQFNGCSGASGEKFEKVCRHCPFWFEYCKRILQKKQFKTMKEAVECQQKEREKRT